MKLLLGLLCTFLASLHACNAALLGAKECTFGPSYWCSSLRNAKQCNAVTHCIQTVWEKQILPEDNDDVCKICKDMVKEARDQLLSNETQDEIRQVFEGSCKLIPLDIVQKECIKLSDEFIPELVDTLASQMNPQVVCATAGLCNSPRIDRMLLEQKASETSEKTEVSVKKQSPRDCNDCKTFAQDVVDKVKSLPRNEVLNHILSICGRLGSLSDGCMSLVQTNFEFIYNFLTTGLHPQDFCDTIGMCERMYGNKLVTAPRTEDEPCDFCVAIVKHWKDNLVANTTREEFKMILDGICEHTGNFEKECLSLVDQYFEVLYNLLVAEVDPKEICEAAGLCGVNALFKSNVPVWTAFAIKPEDHLYMPQVNPFFDSGDFTGLDEAASYKSNDDELVRVPLAKPDIAIINLGESGYISAAKKPEITKSDECVMCEFVLHFLQNVLNDKSTREEIIKDVENVCKLFPHDVMEECEDYIEAYGDQIIQLIILEIDPSQVCPMIHLCPGINMFRSMKDDTTCILCEYVMTQIDQILGDKKTEDEIKSAVDSVCTYMPKSIRGECKSFIDMYIDQIVDLLINDVTPEQVCTNLGLCPHSRVSKLPPLDPSTAQLPISRLFVPIAVKDTKPKKSGYVAVQSTTCVICEFIMAKIDSVLVQNSTEKDIRHVVDRICLWLPHSLANDCLGFMEEYSNSIVELLVSYMNPGVVCTKLKLCKANNFMQGMVKADVALPIDKCLVCEEVIQWIDQKMNEGALLDLVQLVVDNVCKIMPKQSSQECIKLVTRYGDFLIKLIKELTDPKHVCQAISMCPYHGMKPLLGAKKCTWGPTYWCQSQLHAQSCKALDHCKEKVWSGSVPNY